MEAVRVLAAAMGDDDEAPIDEPTSVNLLTDKNFKRCPAESGISLDFPSTTIVFAVLAFLTFVVGAVVACRYNHLTWSGTAGRNVLPIQSVSNNFWVLYFAICTLRAATWSVLFGVDRWHNTDAVVDGLLYGQDALHAASEVLLTVALMHQYFHRSDCALRQSNAEVIPSETTESEYEDRAVCGRARRVVSHPFFLSSIAAALTCVAAWFATHESDSPYGGAFWVFLGCASLQRVAIYILVGLICFPCGPTRGSTPSACSRFVLLLGFLLNLPYDIPYRLWESNILPDSVIDWHDGCTFHSLSLFDGMAVLRCAALFSMFFFVVSEYRRTHELELYDCIQQYSA